LIYFIYFSGVRNAAVQLLIAHDSTQQRCKPHRNHLSHVTVHGSGTRNAALQLLAASGNTQMQCARCIAAACRA
jgi:primosomal replication protein N